MKKNHKLHNNRRLLVSFLFGGLTLCLATLGGGLSLVSSNMYDHTRVRDTYKENVSIKKSYITLNYDGQDYCITWARAGSQAGYDDFRGSFSLQLSITYTISEGYVYLTSYDYCFNYNFTLPTTDNYHEEQLSVEWFRNNPVPYDMNVCKAGEVATYFQVNFEDTELTSCYWSIFGDKNYFGDTELTIPSGIGSYQKSVVIGTTEDLINNAYDEGYADGKVQGYTEGLNDSLEENGLQILLNTILSSPAYMVGEMFNFEIFGINFHTIISVVLTIGVVVLAISIFKGKE